MVYWRLFLLVVLSHSTLAQPASFSLSQDPVFTTVLQRRLTYPREAERSSIYARVYAGFTVDEKGRVQDISILNHMSRGIRFGFEPTVIAVLKKLPSLNLRYSGSYILPVAFIYVDYRHKDKPFVPQDVLNDEALAGRVLLDEIKVFGNSINSKERIRAAARNEAY